MKHEPKILFQPHPNSLANSAECANRFAFYLFQWRADCAKQERAGQSHALEFLAENAGLVIAELELDAEDTPFERPPWLGAEVTDEERFYNVRLSQKPFRHWPENLLASRP